LNFKDQSVKLLSDFRNRPIDQFVRLRRAHLLGNQATRRRNCHADRLIAHFPLGRSLRRRDPILSSGQTPFN